MPWHSRLWNMQARTRSSSNPPLGSRAHHLPRAEYQCGGAGLSYSHDDSCKPLEQPETTVNEVRLLTSIRRPTQQQEHPRQREGPGAEPVTTLSHVSLQDSLPSPRGTHAFAQETNTSTVTTEAAGPRVLDSVMTSQQLKINNICKTLPVNFLFY